MTWPNLHIDDLLQNFGNSSVIALELLKSCAEPLTHLLLASAAYICQLVRLVLVQNLSAIQHQAII